MFFAEGMADDCNGGCSGPIIVGNNQPARGGADREALKIAPRHQFPARDLGLAVDRHIHGSYFPGVAIGEHIREDRLILLE